MTETKQNNDGEVPVQVLNQLGEYTIGGFALFSFNSNTGLPQHVLSFDSPAHALAMQKYLTDWVIALNEIQIEGAMDNIRSQIQSSQEEEEE